MDEGNKFVRKPYSVDLVRPVLLVAQEEGHPASNSKVSKTPSPEGLASTVLGGDFCNRIENDVRQAYLTRGLKITSPNLRARH